MVEICDSIEESGGCNASTSKTQQENLVKDTLSKIKSKFIIMSGKGGVGKTSTTVNLALALASLDYKVGVIDVDLHGPDIPRMLGINAKMKINSENKLQPIKSNNNLSVVSVESIMPSRDDAVIWRGPMKYSAIQQFIGSVDWGYLDFLLIDAPPGTGDEPLTVAQTVEDAKAIIVTTPQEVALADVRKSINFCKTLKIDIFGIIENMSELICDKCQNTINLFGSGGGGKNSRNFWNPFSWQDSV